MAKLYDVAKELKDIAEEGIGWLVVWKKDNSWHGAAVWPDYEESTDTMVFQHDERERLEEIVNEDPDAILVNSYVHNLGVEDYRVGSARLEDNLRYHYKHKTSLAADYIY